MDILRFGHSVGGQIAGLLEDSSAIIAMLPVFAQSGYWKLQGSEQKLFAGFHVHITFPVSARVLGYVPWSWFCSAEDLPVGVAREWSKWCRNTKYLLGDVSLPLDRYSQFAAPVLAYGISDDKWGTHEAVSAMSAAYPSVERRTIFASGTLVKKSTRKAFPVFIYVLPISEMP